MIGLTKPIFNSFNYGRSNALSVYLSEKIQYKIMPEKVTIPENILYDLYVNQNIGSKRIAKMFNCTPATVIKKLRKIGVKIRKDRTATDITKDKLITLYIGKNLSTWKIANVLKHSRGTIYRKLKEFGINPRDISDSHIVYPRKQFNQNPLEKAYLVGFATGDLRVRKVGKKSKTIKVDCRTTMPEQVRLINNLFKNYGRVWIGRPNKEGKVQIEAFLDDSFSFLLNTKKETTLLLNNDEYFLHFLAGFVDADGSIFITNKQARFAIGSYNSQLLKKIRKKLLKLGIVVAKLVRDKKLYIDKSGYKRNNYYWHLTVNRKDSLINLFNIIGPYLKHEKRVSDMQKAIHNLKSRGV